MSRVARFALTAGAFAALSLSQAPALRAQTPAAAAPDSLAFPRQFVGWVFSTQGDSAYAHAGPKLRESMKSPASINEMSGRIAARFGEAQETTAEVQFDEGTNKVYIAVMRFAQAPEPGAWVVVYSPATKIVERSSFGPVSRVKSSYPQAKLP